MLLGMSGKLGARSVELGARDYFRARSLRFTSFTLHFVTVSPLAVLVETGTGVRSRLRMKLRRGERSLFQGEVVDLDFFHGPRRRET